MFNELGEVISFDFLETNGGEQEVDKCVPFVTNKTIGGTQNERASVDSNGQCRCRIVCKV